MQHVRGAPYHPQTQGKIERWHQTLKSRILLDNYYLPGDLERAITGFIEHYNHHRYTRASTISHRPTSTSGAANVSSTPGARPKSSPSTKDADYTSQQQPDPNPMSHSLP